jgi:hypothetical protein
LDIENVMRARGVLQNDGSTQEMCYEPDIKTDLNTHRVTAGLTKCSQIFWETFGMLDEA